MNEATDDVVVNLVAKPEGGGWRGELDVRFGSGAAKRRRTEKQTFPGSDVMAECRVSGAQLMSASGAKPPLLAVLRSTSEADGRPF